jgi:chloride channel protein, CIC family
MLAIVIGVLSGMAVVCFQLAISWARIKLLGPSLAPPWPRVVLAPTLAGLVIAAAILWIVPRVRGSGVNQTKAALYIYNGYIPFRTVIGKFVLCALAIGSGQSLGPEDPSLQIGAGLASIIGRKLRLSRERVRLIAPVGAAAGLAAAFNAPITAVLFVIEEVVGRWSVGVLGAVVLAALSSAVVERTLMGSEPLFRLPPVELAHPTELLAYAALGVVGGLASLVFVTLISRLRPPLKAMPRWTQLFQPALAGLIIGFIGIRFPQIMGAGYGYMDHAMHGQYTWQILGILAGLKILSTTISFVSGTPGGMFAPTLFIGCMLGAAVGSVEHNLFPHLAGPVGAYALVGMGTLFAGFLRAPMTSVFMILEVSGNYSIIVPVILSNTIAYLISRAFQPTPIFDILTRQDGLALPSMEEQREIHVLHVEDAMRPALGPVLKPENTVAEALATIEKHLEPAYLVSLPVGDWLLVTKDQLRELAQSGHNFAPLRTALDDAAVPCLHPDHALDFALRQLGDRAFLPVVHRANYSRLEGIVSLADVLAAYRRTSGE